MRRSVPINAGASAFRRNFSVLSRNSRGGVICSPSVSSVATPRVTAGLVLRKIFQIKFKPLRSSCDARGGR